jgi:hypothetical protein
MEDMTNTPRDHSGHGVALAVLSSYYPYDCHSWAGDSPSVPHWLSSAAPVWSWTPRRGSDWFSGLRPALALPLGQFFMSGHPCQLPMNQMPTHGLIHLQVGLTAWQAMLRAPWSGEGEALRIPRRRKYKQPVLLWLFPYKAYGSKEMSFGYEQMYPRIFNRVVTEKSVFLYRLAWQ